VDDELGRILYNPVVAKTVPFTEARARLSELLDELERRHEHVVITRKGRPSAVLVPADEQEALEETLEILQDEDLLDALRESEADAKAGRLRTLREVRRELGLG
jgi:prevent-host-death family protein